FGGGGGGAIGGGMPEPIEIMWDNPNGDYYIVAATCITPNPTPVFDTDDDDDTASDFPLSFQTETTQGASLQLSSQSFSYYGKYIVKICRIQPEYVVFCQSMNLRSVTLPELHVNIENGFGLFTGISSVSVEVYVISN
ncbi:MAG: hypothetical protein LBD91_02275, partial [Prevotellaceae bacterium]|nr:hypothetical protein [Prevotellaceae bacterium]